MSAPAIIVIAGPTGAGKSALAFQLAKRLGGELINADSVSVFTEFDIGSAKPSRLEQHQVPHHLLSMLSPGQAFSAGAFAEAASRAIVEVTNRGKLPVVVGGTGLYLRALLNGLRTFGPGEPEALARLQERESQHLLQNGDVNLAQFLHQWLAELDPKSAAVVHPSHLSRIRRAIIVRLSTGESFVGNEEQESPPLSLAARVFWLNPPRATLYRSIDQRTAGMINAGLLEEVRQIEAKWGSDISTLRSIGYAEAVQVNHGELPEVELIPRISQATRRFAKRQLTWWRNEPKKLGWNITAPIVSEPGELLEKVVQECQVFWATKALEAGVISCSEVQILAV